MIGVILAAGVGSRLRPLTDAKPKCLVTAAGEPFLEYQLRAYRRAGIREIVIVVGYEGAAIREYCKHIKDLTIHIVENVDYETTNNMYSLHLAKSYVEGRSFILNNADLVIDARILQILVQSGNSDAIAVDSSLYQEESMKVSLDEDGFVNQISKKIAASDAHACSIDFYKFSSQSSTVFFNEINRIIDLEHNLKDWTEVAMDRLFSNGILKFKPVDIAGLNWVEVDNYDDLALADRKFSHFDSEINDFENYVFDLDGTLYVGSEAVDGAAQTIEALRKRGKQIFYLSNNSSRTKDDCVEKLMNMGIFAEASEIILSTDAVLAYLNKNSVKSVFVLGTEALRSGIEMAGFDTASDHPEFVVVGYDTQLTYEKLVMACRHINAGVDIIATHCDVFCPSEYGPIPDIGALLELLRMTTGKSPKKIFGKPDPILLSPLTMRPDFNGQRTLIIGDRLHTDIRMGRAAGCRTLLVLSGDAKREELESTEDRPDFVLKSVGEILN